MTTQDLKQIEHLLDRKLRDFPTKDDIDTKLVKLKDDLENTIGGLGRQLIGDLVLKEDHEELEKRVDSLEEKLQIS